MTLKELPAAEYSRAGERNVLWETRLLLPTKEFETSSISLLDHRLRRTVPSQTAGSSIENCRQQTPVRVMTDSI